MQDHGNQVYNFLQERILIKRSHRLMFIIQMYIGDSATLASVNNTTHNFCYKSHHYVKSRVCDDLIESANNHSE